VLSKSAILAIEDINAAGGIGGRPLQYVVEDTKCNAQGAITGLTKIMDVDKIKVAIGPMCSSEVLAVSRLVDPAKTLVITTFAASDDISRAGDFIFRLSVRASNQSKILAKAIKDRFPRAAVLSVAGEAFQEGLRRQFVAEYTALGGQIVADERYSGEQTDFRSNITKVIRDNPPALFINCQGAVQCGTILKQVRQLGYSGQLFGADQAVNSEAITVAGTAAEDMIAVVAPFVQENKAIQDFLAKYRARHGKTAWEFFMAATYDAVNVLAKCIGEAQGVESTERIRDCLYATRAYQGLLGTFGFDRNGDVEGVSQDLVVVKDAKLTLLKRPS
jgi:branched-chain amino acid transport system substrate-binding protein